MCTFKNLEEIWKTWKKFEKTSGNPVYICRFIFLLIKEPIVHSTHTDFNWIKLIKFKICISLTS